MELSVRRISAADTHELRHRVLWPHLASPEVCVIDIDTREDAFHVGVFADDKLISIGSFFALQSPRLQQASHYRLRAMATDANFRRIHAGERLISFAVDELRDLGVEVLWCDARLVAVPFYEHLGFQKSDDVYEVPLIGPHHFMWKMI
jgi:GNAT superfamily N-acetyltransferase